MLRIFSVLAALVISQAEAQSTRTVETCRQIENDVERLACYDSVASANAATTQSSPVMLSTSFFNVMAVNTYRGINAPRIELHVSFANASDKPVTGLSVFITIKDAFGDDVLATDAKMDIAIAPHTQTSATPYFYWEDSELMPDNAYRKMYNAVWTKKAKVEVAVKKILFQDGSVESY